MTLNDAYEWTRDVWSLWPRYALYERIALALAAILGGYAIYLLTAGQPAPPVRVLTGGPDASLAPRGVGVATNGGYRPRRLSLRLYEGRPGQGHEYGRECTARRLPRFSAAPWGGD